MYIKQLCGAKIGLIPVKKRNKFNYNNRRNVQSPVCKDPATPNGDGTALVQRSENLSTRYGVAAKYT